jgi:hypothetical protein
MAIQEFLSGGYIGKLGDTVGQRWKSKRMIREYVVPDNPQTPAQLKVRGEFTAGIRVAQAGMNFSGHSGVVGSETRTEFQERVSFALSKRDSSSIDFYGFMDVPEAGGESDGMLEGMFNPVDNDYQYIVFNSVDDPAPLWQVYKFRRLVKEKATGVYSVQVYDFTNLIEYDNKLRILKIPRSDASLYQEVDFRLACIRDRGQAPLIVAKYKSLNKSDHRGQWASFLHWEMQAGLDILYWWGDGVDDAWPAFVAAQPQGWYLGLDFPKIGTLAPVITSGDQPTSIKISYNVASRAFYCSLSFPTTSYSKDVFLSVYYLASCDSLGEFWCDDTGETDVFDGAVTSVSMNTLSHKIPAGRTVLSACAVVQMRNFDTDEVMSRSTTYRVSF